MKLHPFIALTLVAPLHAAVTTTHQEYALALLNLLSEVEVCLAQCQDEQSIEQNMDQLRLLSGKVADLAKLQKEMLDPTIADYIAAEKHVSEFNMLWNAIKDHIERLKTDGLYGPELKEILKY